MSDFKAMCFGYTIEEGVRVDKNGIAFFKMDSPSRVVNFNLIDNENDFLETSSQTWFSILNDR